MTDLNASMNIVSHYILAIIYNVTHRPPPPITSHKEDLARLSRDFVMTVSILRGSLDGFEYLSENGYIIIHEMNINRDSVRITYPHDIGITFRVTEKFTNHWSFKLL